MHCGCVVCLLGCTSSLSSECHPYVPCPAHNSLLLQYVLSTMQPTPQRRLRNHVKRSKSFATAVTTKCATAANKQMATKSNSKMTVPMFALVVVTILSAACLSTVQASANKAAPPPSLMYRTAVTHCHNTRPHHAALTNEQPPIPHQQHEVWRCVQWCL